MTARERTDFIRDIIDEDLRTGRHQRVATRFPPEPNGYLHIGHAKSICLNFGIAQDYGGTCNLRYDDTNPTKEDVEYVESIEADVRWLGFAPTAVLFSADYFPRMYELAEKLVTDGKAYVCDLDDEQIRVYRGSLTEPGKPSPWRDRSVAENLDLLRRMKAGEFPDGARTLRAKIDLESPNMKMRDPLLYRIRHAHHHRTGDGWCIYPMYDYAHPLEDAIEDITHSICTLEFENNRELYDWVIEHTGVSAGKVAPHQYEFARLSLDYTMMSKRKLLLIVQEGHVSGWDDPRMPTIAGMRRRGYSPEAIRAFADLIGVAKANSTVDVGKLEFCVRDDLNASAPRVMAVLRPLEVEVTTYDATGEVIDAPYFPADVGKPGSRPVPMARTIYIEQDDFQAEPEAGYTRLAPGRTVRLRYGACITCDEVVRDADGAIVKLRCSHHAESVGGKPPADGRKVWGVIHWVAADSSVPVEVRLYDRLFKVARPDDGDFRDNLNPGSLEVITGARVEASLATAAPGSRWQFERLGYFAVDTVDSKPGALVWNRIVTLRDGWAKKDEVAAPAVEKKASARAATRPKSKSPAEYRAEARVRDPELAAAHDRALAKGLTAEQADLVSGDRDTMTWFDAASAVATPGSAARWLINEVPRVAEGRELNALPFDGAALGALVQLIDAGTITGTAGKDILAELAKSGGDPVALAKSRAPAADAGALAAIIDDVIAKNADKAAQYRAGKTGLLGFFVGQVVKAAAGTADPASAKALIEQRLAAG
ncbi:MAG: glutamine--tRNA ligase/YqeY domain fusion protein [Deltaproteobacteria bacterium]|nr:glutamine--tRNA ligase/YqeY domain fusion protein [Deltaproteobacteria bacterium]